MEIEFSEKIKEAAPDLKIIKIEASVINSPTSDALWNEIERESSILNGKYKIEEINKLPGILATRNVYKALGKDPNRYRPSAEALCRRIVNGKGIYRMTTLIDAINLISITTGYSIGGFDKDKIDGDMLLLDAGTKEDQFNAIGRGALNIEGLPVYRDASGGIGTPTSDEERTKLTPDTTHLLMIVNVYGESEPINVTVDRIKTVLDRHASLSSFSFDILKP